MKVFFRNEVVGRTLVFREDLCSGCGDCIDVCPQKFLLPVGGAKRSVGWKTRVVPEPAGGVCAECDYCLPTRLGGAQRPGESPVLCPFRVCTMCDFCTKICPDKAIYTVPLLSMGEVAEEPLAKVESADRNLRSRVDAAVNYEGSALENPSPPSL